MKVIRTRGDWQVSTNFRLYGAEDSLTAYTAEYKEGWEIVEDIWGKNYWQFITALETLKKAYGRLSIEQIMDLLNTTSQ